MSTLRVFFSLVVCVALTVTAQGMAFARGQADAADQRVLCLGLHVAKVYVDAQGQPTSPPQLCGDSLAVFAALPFADAFRQPRAVSHTVFKPFAVTRLLQSDPIFVPARGPPFV